jgi:glutathione S-transferase
VERWQDWLLAALNAPFLAVFRESRKKPEERGAEFATASGDLLSQLKILEGHMAERQFIALDRFTIADAALAPIVKRCLAFPIERAALPNLDKWQKAIEARPAFQVAIGAQPSVASSAA